MTRLKTALFLLGICLLFSFCKKDDQIVSPPSDIIKTGNVVFDFQAFANDSVLKDSTWFKNANGDTFTVSRLNYYISNIRFIKADASVFSEVESYHLNKHLEGSSTFTVHGVPEGAYTGIEFMIGVDSTRNVSGAQTGALDLSQGMFWDWNSGYVFFKLQGLCKTVNTPAAHDYIIHVGGFSGANNCLQTCSFTLAKALTPKNGKPSVVSWQVVVDKILSDPTVIDFDSFQSVSGGRAARVVSNNYRNMFEISSIEN